MKSQKKWELVFSEDGLRSIKKLDKAIQKRIISSFEDKFLKSDNPKIYAKPLTENLAGLWRFRVGDYRIICSINDERLVIIALYAAHRSKVYDYIP